MENTDKILFPNDRAEWFVALGDRWVGPMEAADVYERVQSGEISWAHYVWREGESEGKRLCETETFSAAVPAPPPVPVRKQVAGAAKPQVKRASRASESARRIWYLYYNDSQYGPFSAEEIGRYLNIGKIHGRVHAWKKDMKNWTRLQELPEFEQALEEAGSAYAERRHRNAATEEGPEKTRAAAPPESESGEKRAAPRRPLVAHVLMSNDESVIVGVCRDISVGGMQVLTDRVPGPAGARIKLNINPGGEGAERIEPFTATGVIVRILEDGRGFSFRFDRLGDRERQAIQEFIRQTTGG